MSEIKLPPLPEAHTTIDIQDDEGDWTSAGAFTVDQLVDYARAAVEADRAERSQDESDMLTATYMCGFEKGKDAALASTPAPAQLTREALSIALEALERSRPIDGSSVVPHNKHVAAIDAVRAAIDAAMRKEEKQ